MIVGGDSVDGAAARLAAALPNLEKLRRKNSVQFSVPKRMVRKWREAFEEGNIHSDLARDDYKKSKIALEAGLSPADVAKYEIQFTRILLSRLD